MLIKTSRQRRIAEDRALLAQKFPNCFSRLQSNTKLPIKIGIAHDLVAMDLEDETGTPISHIRLIEAVSDYCHGPKYQLAILRNPYRVDLNGVNAGKVSESARTHAEFEISQFSPRWHERAKVGRIREIDVRVVA